jgi:D-psicose/D-tagatose/L-ribulose 3-epimerase
MKFGANMLIWTANFKRENLPLLPEIKRHGFDGVEFPMFQPADFALHDIRRGLEQNGLECTVCSVIPNGLGIGVDDASVRGKTCAYIEDCIRRAAEAGAKILAGPFYSPVGYLPGRRRTVDEWSWAVECLQSLGPVLAQHSVTLAIEPLNRFETYFLNTADDAAALCDQVGHPNVGILLDTFHANIEEKSIGQAYRTVAQHLKHVHTCENDRGIPGSGHVEWNEVFGALRDIGYDGWLTIESFGFALPEISAAAAIWRDVAATPESIAFEGVKFLQQNMAPVTAR